MRPFSTPAIILRRTNYGEADRIVNILTPAHGKISAIAKGVRKPKSKLAGGLELFAICELTIMQGRGELGLITSARLKQFFGDILKDYDRMQFAYEAIKLVNRAAETVSEPEFYQLLAEVLAWLGDIKTDWRLAELCFRLRLTSILGRGLNLLTDAAGQKLQADQTYNYDFADNAFYADPRGRFTADHIKLLRLASIKNPAILQQVSGLEKVIDDCAWFVRTVES